MNIVRSITDKGHRQMNNLASLVTKQRPPLPYLRLLLVTLSLAFVGWIITTSPAAAATINVTTTTDELNSDGDCSLREAIIAANTDTAVDNCPAGNGADTINVPAGNYVFSGLLSGTEEQAAATGDLDINGDLTIVGAGLATTTINANGLDRVFEVLGGSVEIRGLTITGGGGNPGHGGGIYHTDGTLTLRSTRVMDNESNGHGGGISSRMSADGLTIVSSRITDNEAAEGGGGVYNSRPLTIVNSAVVNNEGSYGGGIANSFGEATILYSAITGNRGLAATSGGGGIYSSGDVTIVNSTLSGNSTNRGNGGGLNVLSTSTANLYNVTITNNTVDLNVENHPNGGGVYVGSDAEVFLQHTIIAGNADNSTTTKHPDCSGANFESLGYNLIQSTTGCTINGNTTGNLTGVDPLLGGLANNGGVTQTHALLSGSPAVDAGDPAGCKDHDGEALVLDQRGYVRPVNGNAAADVDCDMGAYERLSPGEPTGTFTPTPSHTPTATFTPTPSHTPTATFTPSATATDGPSPTPSATATDGPSPTPSATATDGPSPTPSATATEGPSPTPFAATDWIYFPVTLDQ